MANPDHTTLLLNCFTKTGDRAQLDAFIKAEVGRSGSDNIDELPFDLETAIRVCRQAGFFEHATYLAKKWGRHEDYLRIQVEDAQQYGDALRYVRSLGPEAVSAIETVFADNSVKRTWSCTVECFFSMSQRLRLSS